MVSTADRDNFSTDSVLGESISALVDNQGNELDLARVLKASDSDAHARSQWQRYHQISAAMRGEDTSFAAMDLSAGIRAAIASEQTLVAQPQGTTSRSWLHLLGKTSIAATVAVGFLVGVQQLGQSPNAVNDGAMAEAEPFQAPDLNSTVIPAGFDSPQLSARTVSTGPSSAVYSSPSAQIQGLPSQRPDTFISDPQLQAHFDRLLMIHAQEVSASSDLSVMPFARLTDLNALDSEAVETETAVGAAE
ncbi:sigma-E factor negative regulatory protein [Teredinibacter turnerae]|uniref:sigma-E factor negative regulatory protein n=1 Tax=Teredinibacter turnerae TaxID=2426 RepID=UPI0003755EAB|nr:sigma-E factor negative regulatory protein [Teredinibacter turnerae]